MKKRSVIWLLLALLLCLTACGKEEPDPVLTLVQGNLDAVYTGAAGEDYLTLVGTTPEDCADARQTNLEREADYFLEYFGFSDVDLPEELRQRIVDLYDKLYEQAEYTVGPAAELDESTKAVKVQVSPLDLMQRVMDDTARREELFSEIRRTYYWFRYDSINWADEATYGRSPYYAPCRDAFVSALLTMCEEKLPETEHLAPRAVVVQVYWHEYGYWAIDGTDWKTVDSLIIEYP